MSENLWRKLRVNQAAEVSAFEDDAPRFGGKLKRMHEATSAKTKRDPSPVRGLPAACVPRAVNTLSRCETFVPALALSVGGPLCGLLIEYSAP
jgi:hypothetical protein